MIYVVFPIPFGPRIPNKVPFGIFKFIFQLHFKNIFRYFHRGKPHVYQRRETFVRPVAGNRHFKHDPAGIHLHAIIFVQLNFSHGEIIFQQNDASDNVNVILSGAVALTHRSIQGVEIDIAVMRSGESFGDMSVLSDSPRTVTARAMEQCKLICIPAELYKKLYHLNNN